MKSNFEFLQDWCPIVSKIGNTAETYLYTDPNLCLIKLGMIGETIVNFMLKLDGIPPPEFENTHANRIRLLKSTGLIPYEIDEILYSLRIARNNAIYQNDDGKEGVYEFLCSSTKHMSTSEMRISCCNELE